MKQAEHRNHIVNLALGDLRQEILELERKINDHKVALTVGKTKNVSSLRNYKRELARSLTVAHQKLGTLATEKDKEKSDE